MTAKYRICQMLAELEACCMPYLRCQMLAVHGLDHLRRVAITAGRIAGGLGQDVQAAMVAGFLHDSARSDDQSGRQHALDSASLADEIMTRHYPKLDRKRICDGIARHADGILTADPLIGSVWDADRLDLARLGIRVDPDLLSTRTARRVAVLRICRRG